MKLHKLLLLISLTFVGGALAACDVNKGPAEKAGEHIDNAVDNAGDKIENSADDAGDAIEEAGDKIKEKM